MVTQNYVIFFKGAGVQVTWFLDVPHHMSGLKALFLYSNWALNPNQLSRLSLLATRLSIYRIPPKEHNVNHLNDSSSHDAAYVTLCGGYNFCTYAEVMIKMDASVVERYANKLVFLFSLVA